MNDFIIAAEVASQAMYDVLTKMAVSFRSISGR